MGKQSSRAEQGFSTIVCRSTFQHFVIYRVVQSLNLIQPVMPSVPQDIRMSSQTVSKTRAVRSGTSNWIVSLRVIFWSELDTSNAIQSTRTTSIPLPQDQPAAFRYRTAEMTSIRNFRLLANIEFITAR